MARRLYRSETNRVFAGVCGGIGDYFDVDPVLIRLIFLLLAVFSGGLWLLVYVFLWILMPRPRV